MVSRTAISTFSTTALPIRTERRATKGTCIPTPPIPATTVVGVSASMVRPRRSAAERGMVLSDAPVSATYGQASEPLRVAIRRISFPPR